MEVEPFDGRGYRLGGDGPLTSSSLSTDSNQTTSQFAALSEDPHTQCSFGSAETPLLVNESMEFSAVGTSTDVDTIIDANDSDVSQEGKLKRLRTIFWRSSRSQGCRAVLVASIGTTRVHRRDCQASRRLCGGADAVFVFLRR